MRAAAVALGAILLAAFACASDDDRFRQLQVGSPVPPLAIRTLAGDTVRVGPGQPLTLLNVWATWCIPCERELPDLNELHTDLGPRGLRVIGVSVDTRGDDIVRTFVEDRGIAFTIGRDTEGRFERLYGSIGVPESYLIAPDGTLLWRTIGPIPPGGRAARDAIETALTR